jgi:hypothetical protein
MYTIVLQEILVDRAVHAAASRFVLPSNASLNYVRQSLVMEDFLKAMHGFLPVAMRDLRKYAPDDKDGGWEDVGGLNEAVTIIKEVHTSYFLVLSTCLYGNFSFGYLCFLLMFFIPSCRLLNCHQSTQISLPEHLSGYDQTSSYMDHLDVAKLTL